MSKLILLVMLTLLSSGVNSQTFKNWESFTRVDEMDDSLREGAYTKSLNKISHYRATLYVFCEGGKGMKAYISGIGYYPSHKSPFKVDLRADKNPAINDRWLSLSSKDGVWKGDASNLVRMFKKSNNVVIRTSNGISGADTWKFSGAGFTKSILKARQQCGM